MKTEKRKVVLIGTGMVGMSYAYSMLNQNVCDELVLIDIDRKRAEGEAMDLNHGLAFSGSHMQIYAGDYGDCRDADLVTICAGVAQKPGESRMDLLKRNREVFRSIIGPVVQSGFNGLFLVATNPVDVMTRITWELSGFNARRVIGTGTALDTARLRYLLGEHFHVDPRNIHAYVMGEHGDSEFVPWSQAMIATRQIRDIVREIEAVKGGDAEEARAGGKLTKQAGGQQAEHAGGRLPERDMQQAETGTQSSQMEQLARISEEVRGAAYRIIEAKRATYYGIGMAMTRITKAILGDENSVLTVSALLCGEYGQHGVFVGVPAIINQNGVQRILTLNLTEEEQEKLEDSCRILQESFRGLVQEAAS
ncbi:MAG: L-lactate dehydrogenase [Eubacteriales bacterium]|nr:L-lactate dehydrogenase [Eubacteriales bacterium]